MAYRQGKTFHKDGKVVRYVYGIGANGEVSSKRLVSVKKSKKD